MSDDTRHPEDARQPEDWAREPAWYSKLPREIRVLLAEVPAAMAYIGRDQRYRYVNQRFRSFVAAEHPDGITGRLVSEITADRWEFVKPHVQRVLAGKVASHEGLTTDPEGRPCWLHSTLVPDFDHGEVVGYVLLIVDITRIKRAEQALADEQERYAKKLECEIAERTLQLKKLQEKLVDAERLSAAEQMAGAVAHAINNPLTALIGAVEMAQQHMLETGPALSRIRLLARRIEEVVESTLWMYRQGQVDLCEECPKKLVEWVHLEVAPRAMASGVEIELEIGSALPQIFADRTLLCSALGCIVENAVQASPRGGRVSIQVLPLHDERVIRIGVVDRGPGIPDELRTKVLEPFFTTKAGGTGFGLAIAAAVVQGHGGSLRIQDHPDGGTRVEIDLLTAQGGARASSPLTPPPPSRATPSWS